MRLPYITDEDVPDSPTDVAILRRIQDRRAPGPLLDLDRALLHAPPIADGWNLFYGAIRTRTSLPDDLKELVISRVAVINQAWYEWMQHAHLAVRSGVNIGAMEFLKTEKSWDELERNTLFTEKQWAVVLYTDEMTRKIKVKEETIAVLKTLFSDREIVEITATIAGYNCVSRFLVALDVGERNETGPTDDLTQ